jgi:Fic family protein
MVESLLEDLCSFCNDDSLPAVAQAAIAHAQFEAIHPFADGNGRVGRALIHVLFRRRGLVSRVSPPISLVLATQAKDYIGGLNAAAYVGTPDSQAAHDGVNIWVERFASACNRAVKDTEAFEQRIQSLQDTWRQRIGPVRSDSAIEILFEKLPGVPVLTAQSAADFTKRSVQAVNEAITRLVEAGILVQIRTGRRNRAFEASEIVDAFTDLERRLASPAGDTRVAPPTRKVPRH